MLVFLELRPSRASHRLAIFALPLWQMPKAGRCGEQLTTPRSISASHVPHLSPSPLGDPLSALRMGLGSNPGFVQGYTGAEKLFLREYCDKLNVFFCVTPFPHQTLRARDSSAEGQCPYLSISKAVCLCCSGCRTVLTRPARLTYEIFAKQEGRTNSDSKLM